MLGSKKNEERKMVRDAAAAAVLVCGGGGGDGEQGWIYLWNLGQASSVDPSP